MGFAASAGDVEFKTVWNTMDKDIVTVFPFPKTYFLIK
jgi:hypothetical protein